MTSPKPTHLFTKPKASNSTLITPQESGTVAAVSELNCINSEFLARIHKEAAKQAKALYCQNNVPLSSPRHTRLCLIPTQTNEPPSTLEAPLEIPSSSYLKGLERELQEHIRKVAIEQTKSIICRHSEAMTSPRLSRSCLIPTVDDSMHYFPQESINTFTPSYIQCIENELFEQIRKVAAEQTKAMIIRNMEAVTSPRYSRSYFKPNIDISMQSSVDKPRLECNTDDSYDIFVNKHV